MIEEKERFKTLYRALGITHREIADRLGASGPLIATYISGTRRVPLSRVEKICAEFGVRRQWWETGEGEIFEKGRAPQLKQEPERVDPNGIVRRSSPRRKYLEEVDAEGWIVRAKNFLSICPDEFKRDLYEILTEERR